MGTTRPRPRTSPTLGSQNAARDKDREQIRRLLSTQKKPKVAPAVTGALSMNEVWASAIQVSAGSIDLDGAPSLTYAAVSDPTGSGSPIFVDASSGVLTVPAGWYSITLTISLWWADEASAPASVGLYIQGGDAAGYNNESVFRTCQTFDGWGVYQVVSNGPTYIRDGRDIHPEVRMRSGAAPTTSAGGYLALTVVRHA